MCKEDMQARVKEIDGIIVQQGQMAQQINNQIVMLHGAKEELNDWLKKFEEKEKKDKEGEVKDPQC